MFPALYLAEKIEKMGADVRFHATTRSPIVVSQDVAYPLRARYKLHSLYDSERDTYVYDSERDTYVYDLENYDHVFIITDTTEKIDGSDGLLVALESQGNQDVTIVRWCKG